MILQQYYLQCLSQASYLIGDEKSGHAVLVDPRRDIDEYLADAGKAGLTIRDVFLTHIHADFLAGHLELKERVGARIHLGRQARVAYPAERHQTGDRLVLGDVALEVIETPGHTLESICLKVFDLAKDARVPQALLTGDTLFIGDVGRPDLLVARDLSPESLASQMYDSLHQEILPLPDSIVIYPGHGAGSSCGRKMSSATSSTLGEQRRHNYALQPMSRAEFVAALTEDRPRPPAYFALDARLNGEERATLPSVLDKGRRALGLDLVLRHMNEGAQLLDVRDPDEYALRHVKGSVNIGLGGRFAQWAGTVLDLERPIVLIAPPGREDEAVMRLGRIGLDTVEGFVEGGIAAFAARDDLCAAWERVSVEQLDRDFAALCRERRIVDVRASDEWNSFRIPDATLLPLPELTARGDELPRDRTLLVHCLGGYRSAIAASLLEARGYRVSDLRGGISAFEKQAPQRILHGACSG